MKIKVSTEIDGYLKADHLKISTTSIESVDVGEIVWNQVDGTFDMGLIGGVTLQAGQEMHIYGKATEAISNGEAVMFAGVQGDHLLIARADATIINANPEYLIGVSTQSFTTNQFGYVTTLGNVRGLDTLAYTLGNILYYNSESATDGLLTATEPTAPNAKIEVAAVVKVHGTQGILLVRPHVMPRVKDLQDIHAPSPTQAKGLFWNNTNSRYENYTVPEILGYTPADDTNVVHKTGAETVLGQKTFNGTLNTTTSIFNLAAVDNFPTGGVPDSIRSAVKGHNGTSGSLVCCLYGLIENNKNAGVAIENLDTMADATNSVGVRIGFKSTSTTNNFYIGRRGDNNVFRVNDYGDIYGTKIILGTTVDNTIDTLQVNGSARIVKIDPTGIGGITTKLLSYSADPYGLVFRAYPTGEHSIQNQKESSDTTWYPLLLQPLGGNLGVGTLTPGAKLDVNGDALINGLTVGRGAGNAGYETGTALGVSALAFNQYGYENTAVGYLAYQYAPYGSYNTAIGSRAMNGLYSGSYNASIGYNSLSNASYISSCVGLGSNSQTLNSSDTNSIVIGANATGLGSNTVVLGDANIVTTILRGNVGVNTTTIGSKLQVNGNAAIGFSASTAAPSNGLLVSGGTGVGTTSLATPGTGGLTPILAVGGLSGAILQLRNTTSITTSGSNLGVIQFVSSYYGTPYAAANIKAVSAQGTSGGSSGGANIVFETSTGLTSEVPTERMRLLNNGHLGIGITNPFVALDVAKADASGNNAYFGNGTSGLLLQTNSTSYDIIGYNKTALNNIKIRATSAATNQLVLNTAGNVGIKTATISYTLHVNGSVAGTSAYVNLSDRRHKKNILPIENALDKVLSLNGVTFNWDKSNTDMNLDDRNHIGLLAQDVELIIPQAVVTADDDNKTKSVAYTDLIPVLIEAIKELKEEIELLKNK